jgi:hypothetical protein
MEDKWGYGNPDTKKPFGKVFVRGLGECDLLHGEHPHSRQDNTIYARAENGEIVGFDGHRMPLEISIAENNYLKSSGLSGDEIRKWCLLTIRVGQNQIYEEGFRSWGRAVIGLQRYVDDMEIYWDLVLDEKARESWVGKTVGYKEQFFIVERFVSSQSCVMLKPKDGVRKPFLWETKDEDYEDYELSESVKVEYSHVDWYVFNNDKE